MAYWLGIFCLYYGSFQLLLNEPSVRMKRSFKPWWRDPKNPRADRILFDALRLVTFIVAIVMIELGVYLSGTSLILELRIGLYTAFALLALVIRFTVCRNSAAR